MKGGEEREGGREGEGASRVVFVGERESVCAPPLS